MAGDQPGTARSSLLEIERLSVTFKHYSRGLRQQTLQVLSDLSLTLEAGEIVAVVGASGSGKSLLAQAILGILPANAAVSGDIRFAGEPLTAERQARMRGQELAYVPQSVSFLNPLMKAGKQVRLAFKQQAEPEEASVGYLDHSNSSRFGPGRHWQGQGKPPTSSSVPRLQGAWRLRRLHKRLAKEAQGKIFARYKLTSEVNDLYPHELSGGMARRVLVAAALVHRTRLIVADEPTPGLDQQVVLETLRHLKEQAEAGAAVLLITHDLQAAVRFADKIVVLYAGTTIEAALAEDFTKDGARLRHPYTRALWKALPVNGFVPLPGVQPHPAALPSGCLFAPRCDMASAACRQERPSLRPLRDGKVKCIHAT